MQFTNETARGSVVIQSLNFQVPRPFAEKHVCTSAEADALNQLLAENTRNNFAKRVKDAGKDANIPELQKALDEYVVGYEFGVRRGGSADPVEREAMRMASEAVKRAIKAKGLKLSDYSADNIRDLAAGAMKKNPKIRIAAEKAIKERDAIGVDLLDEDAGENTSETN